MFSCTAAFCPMPDLAIREGQLIFTKDGKPMHNSCKWNLERRHEVVCLIHPENDPNIYPGAD